MRAIFDPRIFRHNNKFVATCLCGKVSAFSTKDNAIKMLERGICRSCRPDYVSVQNLAIGIYKRQDGRWCCKCSGCASEQAYTRKDHAKQSHASDWQCKTCAAHAKKFSANQSVGDYTRAFNRFRKSAKSRGLVWELTENQMFAYFSGFCEMTGWPISLSYTEHTASLDRIDSKVGYVVGNIQWVHAMVNMSKNRYDVGEFIAMCKAVAERAK
jgi:hypothetical protein